MEVCMVGGEGVALKDDVVRALSRRSDADASVVLGIFVPEHLTDGARGETDGTRR